MWAQGWRRHRCRCCRNSSSRRCNRHKTSSLRPDGDDKHPAGSHLTPTWAELKIACPAATISHLGNARYREALGNRLKRWAGARNVQFSMLR